MRRRYVTLTVTLLISALLLGACSTAPAPDESSQESAAVQEAPAEPAPTPEPEPEPEEEPEEEVPEVPEDDLTGVLYTDEFTPAAWADFGSEEKSGEHGEDLICIRGTVGDYDEDKHALILKAADGDWTVNCGQALSYAYNEMMVDLRGQEMRVFGTYAGFSQSSGTPRISFIKGVPEHACRMESLDGEKRITYLDSIWENIRADKDYALGHLTWKGISDWEDMNEVGERDGKQVGAVRFFPVSDYGAGIYIYYEELPDDLKDWKKADDVFKIIVDDYFEDVEVESTSSAEAAGLEGRRVISIVNDDDMDYALYQDSYVLLDTDAYYVIMFGEPYFTGTMLSDYADEFMDSLAYSKDGAPAKEAEEDKKQEEEEKKDEDAKTGSSSSSSSNSSSSGSSSSSSNKKKTEYPKYGDIMGTYSIGFAYQKYDLETGELVEEKSSDHIDTIDGSELVSYDEDTGVAIMLWQLMENDSRSDNIPTYFRWTDDGKVQFAFQYEFDYNDYHYHIYRYGYMQ